MTSPAGKRRRRKRRRRRRRAERERGWETRRSAAGLRSSPTVIVFLLALVGPRVDNGQKCTLLSAGKVIMPWRRVNIALRSTKTMRLTEKCLIAECLIDELEMLGKKEKKVGT